MSIDFRDFRDTLGCFATGITVITTVDGEGAPVGMTANAFTSLSLEPPLVLFCLDRKGNSFEAFHTNRSFAVNILAAGQEDLSRRFASKGPQKWSGVTFDSWDTGCPILRGCIANLECQVDSVFEGGDHVIVVGKVMRLERSEDETRPLLYFRGRYAELAD